MPSGDKIVRFDALLWCIAGIAMGSFATVQWMKGSLPPVGRSAAKATDQSKIAIPNGKVFKSAPASKGTVPPEFAAELRKNAEDKRAGNYVLDGASQFDQERQKKTIRETGERNIRARGPEYDAMFARYGIPPETAAQLKAHLQLIYEAKAQASIAATQVITATLDYDRRMKAILGDNYDEYHLIEMNYPFRKEVERFAGFARGAGMAFDQDDAKKSLELFKKHDAISFQTSAEWGGPYQEMPPPIGGVKLKAFVEDKLASLDQRSLEMLSDAAAVGLSDSGTSVLRSYLAQQHTDLETMLQGINDPAQGVRNMLVARISQLRKEANPDSGEVARLEARLDDLNKRTAK